MSEKERKSSSTSGRKRGAETEKEADCFRWREKEANKKHQGRAVERKKKRKITLK